MRKPVLLVEAPSFRDLGGWVIDQQSMDAMGSSYVLAHGLGVPVADAVTDVTFAEAGDYRVWVRTRDWVGPWKQPGIPEERRAKGCPGRFQVVVADNALSPTFGTEEADWHWQDGGTISIPEGNVPIKLHDLTGFDGRCEAILFSRDPDFVPPADGTSLAALRRQALGLTDQPTDAGEFDLVVVGGGIAGCCAAISAARLGCTVALIQDRPVLGGNNSSEVRVGLSGLIHQHPYPRLGDVVDEIGPIGHWNLYDAKQAPDAPRSKQIFAVIEQHPDKTIHNAGPASNYEDERKRLAAEAETNLRLFLNMHVCRTEKQGNQITAAIGRDIATGKETLFRGRLFADCTGDGTLGFLAGADYRMGREAKQETGESQAPETADQLVMGTSVQWYTTDEATPQPFPDCPWAVRFDETTVQRCTRGDWDWETGMKLNQVTEIERVRDYALRVTYGNWAFLKNRSDMQEELAGQRLAWIAYIGGKRESRRLLGDVILCEQDIVEARAFPDASVTSTWSIDLHYPNPECSRHFPGEEFRSIAKHVRIAPYPIPFRCLYSRSLSNLMMAGRNISVTHVALGTIRVQRTTGMMGEVLGMAATLCREHETTPRGVYEKHLAELEALMRQGVGRSDRVKEQSPGA